MNSELEDAPAEALRLLAHLYLCHQQYDKALTLLEALHELKPHALEIARPLCRTLLLSGRYAEALTVNDEMREHAEDSPLSEEAARDRLCDSRLRAEALWGLGYAAEARHELEQALMKP